MRHLIPLQSVVEDLVQHQANTPLRSLRARIFGRSPLNADSTACYQGARGEIAVGAIFQVPRSRRSSWALLFTAAFIGAEIAAFPLLIDFIMTLATSLIE